MNTPVTVCIGFDETPISEDRQVWLRAFRFAVGGSVANAGGVVAFARPVAVIDRRGSQARTKPVLDPTLLLSAGSFALTIVAIGRALASRRRKRPSKEGE